MENGCHDQKSLILSTPICYMRRFIIHSLGPYLLDYSVGKQEEVILQDTRMVQESALKEVTQICSGINLEIEGTCHEAESAINLLCNIHPPLIASSRMDLIWFEAVHSHLPFSLYNRDVLFSCQDPTSGYKVDDRCGVHF
jgi:hypothetical protein